MQSEIESLFIVSGRHSSGCRNRYDTNLQCDFYTLQQKRLTKEGHETDDSIVRCLLLLQWCQIFKAWIRSTEWLCYCHHYGCFHHFSPQIHFPRSQPTLTIEMFPASFKFFIRRSKRIQPTITTSNENGATRSFIAATGSANASDVKGWRG